MPLPRWRIEIHKEMGGEEWTNDWLTDDDTIEDAQDLAGELLTFEQHVHQPGVLFTYMRISTTVKHDRVFRHLAVNVNGLMASDVYLPLYCTARLDMGTHDRDPCRKYFRMPIAEGWQTNGYFDGAVMTTLGSAVSNYLITPGILPHIVSTLGNNVETAQFYNRIQMRQLHKHKRKKIV